MFDGGGSYGSDLSTTPSILSDGTVLWPAPSDPLIALNPQGQPLWRQRFAGFVLSLADRGDGRVYAMDMAGTLSAMDVGPAGHHLAWTMRFGATSYSSPAISPAATVVAPSRRGGRGGRSRRSRRALVALASSGDGGGLTRDRARRDSGRRAQRRLRLRPGP